MTVRAKKGKSLAVMKTTIASGVRTLVLYPGSFMRAVRAGREKRAKVITSMVTRGVFLGFF